MNRRQFLRVSAAVTGAVLGRESLSFGRRNLGVGAAASASAVAHSPRARNATGRVASIDGSTVSVELTAMDEARSARLQVVRREYPTGEASNEVVTAALALPEVGRRSTVEVDVPRTQREADPWFYEVFLLDSTDRPAFLCESAPYRWTGGTAEDPIPAPRITEPPQPSSRERFDRTLDDNDYVLRYRWRDSGGTSWSLQYPLRRSVHEAAVERQRGYVRTFEESRTSAVARDLAATIEQVVTDRDGEESDLSDGERFDDLVRFVQDIAYLRDFESMDVYDYNRTVEETLVAGVGDCKDKTHLLAGLLGAPPLSCETALLFQPAHVLLGVVASDVPSRFDDATRLSLGGREYVPVDPSLRFDVGNYPDGEITAAYGGGEWIHHDTGAIARGLDRNVGDWLQHAAGG